MNMYGVAFDVDEQTSDLLEWQRISVVVWVGYLLYIAMCVAKLGMGG